MAAYNGAPFLQEQIGSIMQSHAVDVGLTISLDKSFDESANVIENEMGVNPKVFLLPETPPSGGAAANFFRLIADVDFSTSEFIALADQDDIWNPDKLSRACNALVKENASGYSSNVTAFWPDGREKLIDKAQPEREWDHLFESRGPGCTFVLTKAFAHELQAFVRGHREAMKAVALHDWFIYAFARSRGYKWTMDAAPSMRYRQHAGNEVGVNSGWRAARWRIAKLLSGWQITQARLIAELTGLDRQEFVKRRLFAGRLGLVRLAFAAPQCRRQPAHQIVFAVSCLVLSVIGIRPVHRK